MRRRILALTFMGTLAIAACADGTTTETGDDGVATMPTSGTSGTTSAAATDGTAGGTGPETIAEFQAEIDDLGDAISESEAAQELRSAWDTLNAELAASIASLREDRTAAREEIESSLEEFEQRLDELDVDENVRAAWESLKSQVEALTS
jgi:hypothetical protein